MVKSSIYLKAYHCEDGRNIHYAAARLHKNAYGNVSILDIDEHQTHSTISYENMGAYTQLKGSIDI